MAKEVRRIVSDLAVDPYDGFTREPAVVCSLTRAAAAEAAGRDTGLRRQSIGTVHSFAFRALEQPRLVAGNEADFNATQSLGGRLSVGAGRTDDPLNENAGDMEQAYHLLRARLVPRDDWPTALGAWASRYEDWKQSAGLLDFTDLIQTAIDDVETAPGNPRHILMDEAQDSNQLMLTLMRKWAAHADSLTIIGDPDQALYHFAGSHPEMFRSGKIDHTRILGQSYRVPRAVHRIAMRWREGIADRQEIEYQPRDSEGAVDVLRSTWREPEAALLIAGREIDAGRTVMIMASCAYMLAPAIAVMRARGIPFGNRWRLKNGAWNPLKKGSEKRITMVDRLLALVAPCNRDGWAWTYEELFRWSKSAKSGSCIRRGAKRAIEACAASSPDQWVRQSDIERWIAPGPLNDLIGTQEEVALARCWRDQLIASKANTADYPIRIIERSGSKTLESEPRITIGTIHSLKGSEADTVILFPDLSMRGNASYAQYGEERDAVVRMGYVAITRARERLILCEPCGPHLPIGGCID